MTHLLGMHWLKYHQDRRDLEHVERMQYRSIKPFEWMWNKIYGIGLLPLYRQKPYSLSRHEYRLWHFCLRKPLCCRYSIFD